MSALLSAARAGRGKRVYLFVGESFETHRAARALIDALVPAERRAFNLETHDGRTAPLAAVLDSVRTPGFFSGDKLIWLKESSVFLSGEKRSDVAKSMLAAWEGGREQEAAEKFLALAALAGWSETTLRETRWRDVGKTKRREVFGDVLDAEASDTLDAIQAAAFARDLRLAEYRDEAATLAELIEAGVPSGVVLLFTSTAVDARKRVVRTIREHGVVLDLSAEHERSGALARASVDEIVQRILRAHGKRLQPAAQEMVVRRAGAETALLAGELEKLCLFVGERDQIGESDVRQSFRDLAESWVFDLTAALALRDAGKALPVLRSLLAQGEPPLRLIGMIARELRLLLIAREALAGGLASQWSAGMRYDAFQSRVLPKIDAETKAAFGNAHPFVLFRRFQDAARIAPPALRDALAELAALDQRIKSAPNDPATLVEVFLLGWCASASGRRGRAVASGPR